MKINKLNVFRTTPPFGHPSFVRRGILGVGLNSPSYKGGVARSFAPGWFSLLSKKLSFAAFLIIACFTVSSFAQAVRTPGKGSAERTAILNALRVPVEKELKQKIVFSVQEFNVSGNWAFLSGEPQSAGGGKPNYKKTGYQNAIEAGMFDNNLFALLKKTGGKWKVVTYAIGCTDVCYMTWWQDYKAPKAIFPHTE
jgi:hypothetical protein